MFGESKMTAVKRNAAAVADFARQLNSDEKLREHLLSASSHAAEAKLLARRRFGRLSRFREVAMDQQLRAELAEMVRELQDTWDRVGRKRSRRLRKSLLLIGSAGAVIAIVRSLSSRGSHLMQNNQGDRVGDQQAEEERVAEGRPLPNQSTTVRSGTGV